MKRSVISSRSFGFATDCLSRRKPEGTTQISSKRPLSRSCRIAMPWPRCGGSNAPPKRPMRNARGGMGKTLPHFIPKGSPAHCAGLSIIVSSSRRKLGHHFDFLARKEQAVVAKGEARERDGTHCIGAESVRHHAHVHALTIAILGVVHQIPLVKAVAAQLIAEQNVARL